MILRILIVDDEPYIVDDMYEVLKNNIKIDIDVYKAYSGAEALELVNNAKIDIVISDIRMPGINGMDLLRKILADWPECKFIFLTGYNDFEFIQKAIRNEAVDYILKTEDEEAVLRAVERAAEEIDKKAKNKNLILLANEQLSKAVPLLQQEFVLDILQGEETSADIISRRFNELDISLDGCSDVLMLAGRVDCWPEDMGPSEKTKRLYTIQIIAGQYLFAYCNAIPVVYERSVLLWLIQSKYTTDKKEKTIIYIKEALESIQTACRDLVKLSVSFVLSSEFVSWDKTGEKLEELKLILRRGPGFGKEMLLMDNALNCLNGMITSANPNNQKDIARSRSMEVLESYLENGQKKEFLQLLNNITEVRNAKEDNKYYEMIETHIKLVNLFLSFLNKSGLINVPALEKLLARIMKTDELWSWEEIVSCYKQLAALIFDSIRNEQETAVKETIEKLQIYINGHLHTDISLIRLADMVYLNPSYLSRLYKQVTGKNLSDYINEGRLKKATELLVGSKMKIHEIASAVGYESAPYFTRFFKREKGVTPQEFRDEKRCN